MTNLRLHRFIAKTEVEGPGIRACIQVQGCPIRCPGCAVPQTWSQQGGYLVPIASLADRILSGPKVEGVTFLGGEPFAQAAALAKLGAILQDHHLSVMTFTGYTLSELHHHTNSHDCNALLSVTDLLVSGPFLRDQLDLSRPWVGSRNQCYHFLTERYQSLKATLAHHKNQLEVRISPNGQVLIHGMASYHDLKSLINR